jgi:hypothetical protein
MTEFMNLVEEMGIEEENVQRIMDTGIVATYVCNFLLCIFIINVIFLLLRVLGSWLSGKSAHKHEGPSLDPSTHLESQE